MANARIQSLLSAPPRQAARLAASESSYDDSATGQLEYDEDPRSMLTQVTGPIIGAVGAVGNFLDLPGSMVRDVLTLNNPLDQLLTPFSSENRIGGREMLNTWGLTSENKETGIGGWLDDPMEGVQDIAGFAAEMALDPLNLLTAPAKAVSGTAKAGRGLLNNVTDPLRLGELGEKIGARSAVKSAAGRTGRMLSGTADAIEKSKHFGESFGAARKLSKTVGNEINLATRSMFESAVAGTRKALSQGLMRRFSTSKALADDAIKIEAMGIDRRLTQGLKELHGDDFFDRVEAGTVEIHDRAVEASSLGQRLIEPLQQKLSGLGFDEVQIKLFSDSLSEITQNTDTLGNQFPDLQRLMQEAEQSHLGNVESRIPRAEDNELFRNWSTGRGPNQMYDDLGWKQGVNSSEMLNESLGVSIAKLSDSNKWTALERVEGKLQPISGPMTKSKAIAEAHEYARSKARLAAEADFDDVDDFLKEFVDHDRSVMSMMKDTLGESGKPNFLTIREEIRAAAEGAEHNFQWLTPELREIAGELKSSEDFILEHFTERGLNAGPLRDDFIDQVPRRQGETVKAEFKDARGEGEGVFEGGLQPVINSASASTTHRDPAYVNWRTGSGGINGYFRDPELFETMNSVRSEFLSGELKGKIAPQQAKSIRDTLKGLQIGEDSAENLFDDLIKDGMISMSELDSKIRGVAKKAGELAGGSVVRSDGKAVKAWVIGGQRKGYHQFDSIMNADLDGSFRTSQIRRDKELPNQLGSLETQLQPVDYAAARRQVDSHDYMHVPKDSQKLMRAKAVEAINEAEKNGTQMFSRTNADGSFNDIFIPQTYDSVERRLMTQLSNLGKKFDPSKQPDEDVLLQLQKSRVEDFTRRKYGDDIEDAMPRRDDYGNRMAKDYRDGRTGNELPLDEATYEKHLENELITNNLEDAIENGKIYEVVDSRIKDAILPKLFSQDGGYSAYRKMGVFTNDPMFDMVEGRVALNDAKLRGDAFEGFVESFISKGEAYPKLVNPGQETAEYTIDTLLESQKTGVNGQRFLEYLAGKRNPKLKDPKAAKEMAAEVDRLRRIQISSEDWNDLAKGLSPSKSSLVDMPGLGSALKFTDAMTRLFKVGVLAWPARIARDFTSAAIRSIESGMIDMSSPGHAMGSLKLGNAIATGKRVPGFAELLESSPGFRQAFDASQHSKLVGTAAEVTAGKKLSTDEAAFQFFQDSYFMRQGGSFMHTDMDMADTIAKASEAGSLQPLRDNVSNYSGAPIRENAKGLLSDIKNDGMAAANPLNIQGIPQYLSNDPKLRGKPRTESKFFADRVAGHMGKYTDTVTRATAIIDQMRRGVGFEDALARAKSTLVDYDPRRFSNVERDIMKRVFPFYSFLSSQVPYVIKELATNPTGGLGMTVRAQRHAQDDGYVPYHMRDKAAIPLGADEDGNQHYLESLGLMHEDAVGMLKPDLADVLGNMNPLLKAPVELATGRSLFMRGPLGGRELSEMDPVVGRIMQGVGELTGLREKTDARPISPIGATAEHLLSSSPAARLLSTTRTLLDDRKSIGQKAASLLTGFKVSTISPQSQQSMLRAELDSILKDAGVRPFTRYSLRKGDIDEIENEGGKELGYRLRAVEKVRASLDKARKKSLKEDYR